MTFRTTLISQLSKLKDEQQVQKNILLSKIFLLHFIRSLRRVIVEEDI